MTNLFKQANLIPLLLIIYIGKNFILPNLLFDFGIITVLSYLFMTKLQLDKTELNQEKKIFAQIDALELKISEIKKEYDEEAASLKNKISGVNLLYQKQNVKIKEKVPNGKVW